MDLPLSPSKSKGLKRRRATGYNPSVAVRKKPAAKAKANTTNGVPPALEGQERFDAVREEIRQFVDRNDRDMLLRYALLAEYVFTFIEHITGKPVARDEYLNLREFVDHVMLTT